MAASAGYIEFLLDVLKKGVVKRAKAMELFVEKWQVSHRTFERAWKTAQEQHLETKQVIKTKVTDIEVSLEVEARKRQIIDVLERKEILSQIAKGEIPLQKALVVAGQIEYIQVVPDWMDRRNAIAELNKMEGDYAPMKIESELTFTVEIKED